MQKNDAYSGMQILFEQYYSSKRFASRLSFAVIIYVITLLCRSKSGEKMKETFEKFSYFIQFLNEAVFKLI